MSISYGYVGGEQAASDGNGDRGADLTASGNIEAVLDAVMARISAAERRQSEALEQMHRRIADLSRNTADMHESAPTQFRSDIERLQDVIGRLASQFPANQSDGGASDDAARPSVERSGPADQAEAMSAAKARLAALDINDLADMVTAGDPEQPWDADAAEELTRLYETGVTGISYTVSQPVAPTKSDLLSSASPNVLDFAKSVPRSTSEGEQSDRQPAESRPPIEKKWLEDRFAEVASRIEKILAEQSSEAPFEAFDERFATLEERLGAAIQDLAKRSDVAGLGDLEACIGEMVNQLERAHMELARVSEIETQVRELASRVSEERLSAITQPVITPVDIDEIASVVVERIGERETNDPVSHEPFDFSSIANLVVDDLERRGFNASVAPPAVDVEEIASTVVARLGENNWQTPSAGLDAGNSEQLDDLKTMVKGLVEAKRDDSEHMSTMLDTMQQAMIRLLDRMDALEDASFAAPTSGYAAPQPAPVLDPPSGPALAPSLGAATPGSERTFDARESAGSAPPLMRGAPVSDEEHDQEVRAVFGTQGRPDQAPDSEELDHQDVVQHDDWADAHDEQHPEQAHYTDPDADTDHEDPHRDRRHFMEAARRAAQQANERAKLSAEADSDGGRRRHAPYYDADAGEAQETGGKKSLFGSLLRRRVVVTAIAMVLIGAGASALISESPSLMKRYLAKPEIQRNDMLGQNAAPQPTQARVPVLTKPGADVTTGSVPKKASGEAGPAAPQTTPARAGVTPDELKRKERHRQYAVLSGQVGARMPVAENVPASLIPTPDNNASNAPVTVTAPGGKGTTALPSALVGPLSLRLAAANGDPSAEFEVGARFAEGKGVQQDFKQATTWYRRAATRGFALAQYRLATLYERGLGVQKDLARAKIWYERAADQGNVKAMHNLAVLSASGVSGKPDYGMAAHWFAQAAARGLGDSQFNLAILYQSGLGVKRDQATSYMWFGIAARGGDESSKQRQADIARHLKATEMTSADREISTWRKKSTSRLANDPHYAGEQWKRRAKSKN